MKSLELMYPVKFCGIGFGVSVALLFNVTFHFSTRQHYLRYPLFVNLSLCNFISPTEVSTLRTSLRIPIELVTAERLCIILHSPLWYPARVFEVCGCLPCGAWSRRLTICHLYVSPVFFLENLLWISWSVSSIEWRTIFLDYVNVY